MASTDLLICPLCSDRVDRLVYRFHVESESEVIHRIKTDHTDWVENDGACSRCVDYYHTEVVVHQRILPEAGPHFPVKSVDDFIILPTPLRLDADPHFTGKGITICLIDSGFYLHDDLIRTSNRVKAIVDITELKQKSNYFTLSHPESWHGTMTSVVCAGDGFSSNGLYKSIASEAELVLIKTQITNEADPNNGKITTKNITAALQWVLHHHKKHNIKIVSISLGDDKPLTQKESSVNQLAEQLIEKGIVVVAAAGNELDGQLKPPASSPNVITVGGLDDVNQLGKQNTGLYHSTFGATLDGFMKPELIAQAIWLAAPILPGTSEKREAEWLHQMVKLSDTEWQVFVKKNQAALREETKLPWDSIFNLNDLQQKVKERIQTTKFFSPHYMHVDGTSFAAPIVSSIIAQLLQCNPSLTPQEVRSILFKTAKRLPNFEAARQGFGVVHPRRAITQLMKLDKPAPILRSPIINKAKNKIEFYVQHEGAHQISLAGDFNDWTRDVLFLVPCKGGFWKIELPLLPQGTYHYKFLVDEQYWMEDICNPLRVPDNYNGFNSVFRVTV